MQVPVTALPFFLEKNSFVVSKNINRTNHNFSYYRMNNLTFGSLVVDALSVDKSKPDVNCDTKSDDVGKSMTTGDQFKNIHCDKEPAFVIR